MTLIALCVLNGECYPGVLVSIPFSSKKKTPPKSRLDVPVMGKATTPREHGGSLTDV